MMMPVFMIKLSGNYQIKLLLILFIFANLWKMLYVNAFLMTQENNWREKNHHKALIWSKLLVNDRIQKLFCISKSSRFCLSEKTYIPEYVNWKSVHMYICMLI